MPDAVIFDFDGVVVDSEPIHLMAFRRVLRPAGVTLTDKDYYGRYLGFNQCRSHTIPPTEAFALARLAGTQNRQPDAAAQVDPQLFCICLLVVQHQVTCTDIRSWFCALFIHPPTALERLNILVSAILRLIGLGRLREMYLKRRRARLGGR